MNKGRILTTTLIFLCSLYVTTYIFIQPSAITTCELLLICICTFVACTVSLYHKDIEKWINASVTTALMIFGGLYAFVYSFLLFLMLQICRTNWDCMSQLCHYCAGVGILVTMAWSKTEFVEWIDTQLYWYKARQELAKRQQAEIEKLVEELRKSKESEPLKEAPEPRLQIGDIVRLTATGSAAHLYKIIGILPNQLHMRARDSRDVYLYHPDSVELVERPQFRVGDLCFVSGSKTRHEILDIGNTVLVRDVDRPGIQFNASYTAIDRIPEPQFRVGDIVRIKYTLKNRYQVIAVADTILVCDVNDKKNQFHVNANDIERLPKKN